MTADTLKSKSVKDLAEMAKKRGIAGWHGMRKEQLVKALLRMAARKATPPANNGRVLKAAPAPAANRRANLPPVATHSPKNGLVKNGTAKPSVSLKPAANTAHSNPIAPRPAVSKPVANKPVAAPVVPPKSNAQRAVAAVADTKDKKLSLAAKKILVARMKQERMKDLAWRTVENKGKSTVIRDRLVVMVRDAYWLHCFWELSRQGVERAQAALAQDWHTARPVLRLLHVAEGGTTSAAGSIVRDIEIHGGVTNWYIDVQEPPKSFRVEIGYRAANGRFHALARSNVVTTPRPDSKDAMDENWNAVAQDYDKVYALSGGYSTDGQSTELQELFEERLRRPMGSPMVTGFGSGVEGLVPRRKEFAFEVDAEMIVFGKTEPTAHVT
ncbi:MAG: DUF4912 domain-containing protein, partial [Planctomycetaceae bacterium]|nr:DUF4912 domain-containing protein [Planctomycetaceae bacterium]